MLAGEVVIDDRGRDRRERAMFAVRTFDSGLVADAGNPFIGAGRRVAGLAAGLAFPADRIDVCSPVEKAMKQPEFSACNAATESNFRYDMHGVCGKQLQGCDGQRLLIALPAIYPDFHAAMLSEAIGHRAYAKPASHAWAICCHSAGGTRASPLADAKVLRMPSAIRPRTSAGCVTLQTLRPKSSNSAVVG